MTSTADINILNWARDLPNNTHVTHVTTAFNSVTGVVKNHLTALISVRQRGTVQYVKKEATVCKCVSV